ncbi:MAG: HAMP domain-containing protein, partial [Tranquillimonas sp.]
MGNAPGAPMPGLRWLTGSVQGKLLAYFLPLVMISTIVVFGFFEWNARRSAEAQLQTKLAKMTDIQSAVLAEALWNVANEQIKLILAAVMTDEDVLAVSVLDERDRLVAALGAPDAFERSAFTATRDIRYDTGDEEPRIGTLRIALSDARLTELARERLTLVLILAGILMAAVVTATLIVNRRIIGRPLSLLMASISRVASSEPRRRVDWDSGDEIGRVVAAFNEMQARQDAYEAQLRATNDELERRVDERTAEL